MVHKTHYTENKIEYATRALLTSGWTRFSGSDTQS